MALRPRLFSCRRSDPGPPHAGAVLLVNGLTGFCLAEAALRKPKGSLPWWNAEFIKMARNAAVPEPEKRKRERKRGEC